MKRYLPYSLFTLSFLLTFACAETPAAESGSTVRKAQSGNATGGVASPLKLQWNAQSGITAYHVYYLAPIVNAKGQEIDSLQKGAPNFEAPAISIDDTNMESWPTKGNKACFYVVADNAGALSIPSEKVCITI